MGDVIVLLTATCPNCCGEGWRLDATRRLEACETCDALGKVTPRVAADWKRKQAAIARSVVLP